MQSGLIFVYTGGVGIALLPLFSVGSLNAWKLAYLAFIVVGMAWCIWRRALWQSDSSQQETIQLLLVTSVCTFVLSQFAVGNDFQLSLGAFCALLIAIGGFYSSRANSLWVRREVYLLAGVICWTIAHTVARLYGPVHVRADGFSWQSILYVIELVLVYIGVSRLLRGAKVNVRVLRNVLVVCYATISLVLVVGGWQLGKAYYAAERALTLFSQREYTSALDHALSLDPAGKGIGVEALSLDVALYKMLELAKMHTDDPEGYMAIGALSRQCRRWDLAMVSYRKAADISPDLPAVYAHLGDAYFEQGMRPRALSIYQVGMQQEKVEIEDYLSLGLALARMGDWDGAVERFESAIEITGVRERLEALSNYDENGIFSIELGELLPAEFHSYLSRGSLFIAVKLLESKGWKVFHPAEKIGRSEIATPVEIEVSSGGGRSSAAESIKVNGREISLHKRGYNLVTINPQSGAIEAIENFDTWETLSEGSRMASYLNQLPRGRIVAGALKDEGSGALDSDEVRDAFGRIGVEKLPSLWWSHAFIGVKGMRLETAAQALGEYTTTILGVRAGNIPDKVVEDSELIVQYLINAAEENPQGKAIYIPALGPTARVVVARR